jgi:hypothetical protein
MGTRLDDLAGIVLWAVSSMREGRPTGQWAAKRPGECMASPTAVARRVDPSIVGDAMSRFVFTALSGGVADFDTHDCQGMWDGQWHDDRIGSSWRESPVVRRFMPQEIADRDRPGQYRSRDNLFLTREDRWIVGHETAEGYCSESGDSLPHREVTPERAAQWFAENQTEPPKSLIVALEASRSRDIPARSGPGPIGGASAIEPADPPGGRADTDTVPETDAPVRSEEEAGSRGSIAPPPIPPGTKPRWDGLLYRLWLGDVLCLERGRRATVQDAILDEFQTKGWAEWVDSPFGDEKKTRDTIHLINRKMYDNSPIRFRCGKGAKLVGWQRVDLPSDSGPQESPKFV